jgi:hypothetical protein
MRLTFLLLAFAAAAQADLTIVQKTEGAMNAGQLTLRIKGDKARADVAPQLTVLTDLATGDCVTLNHNAKIFTRVAASEAAKMRALAADLKPGAEPPKLTPTTRKEKVEGYDCEVFTWRVGQMEVTDWIARDYPNWQPILAELTRFQSAGLAGAAESLMPKLADFPGMVVKREMQLRDAKTTSTLVSVKNEPLDAAIFDLPKEYKERPAVVLPVEEGAKK